MTDGCSVPRSLEYLPALPHDRPDEQVLIRAYRTSDRPAIRRLCSETGFLGQPISPLFQDSDLFADLFTKPYLDHESQWAMVAEVDGRVIGYLLGSVCPHFALL